MDFGIKHDIPPAMRLHLQENIFKFSGFKTHQELKQVQELLLDERGEVKPFGKFMKEVLQIDETYNRRYLQAEYNFAVHSAQSAEKWERFAADGDDYFIQYKTAGDSRVREEHAALDGITLPPSDNFWKLYFPPNGWNCRCNAVQVNRDRATESNSKEAMTAGNFATRSPKQAIFRFNPGIKETIFPDKHPYYKSGDKWDVERVLAEKEIKVIENHDDYFIAYGKQNKDEFEKNLDLARFLGEKYHWSIELLKVDNTPNTKNADTFNHSLGEKQEYKISEEGTENSIDKEIRKGAKQADHIVIRVLDPKHELNNEKIWNRMNKYDNLKSVLIVTDSKVHRFYK